MNEIEKNLIDVLFEWIHEELKPENLNKISSLSGFKVDFFDNRKNILKSELAFLYLFFFELYSSLDRRISFELRNIFFNLIFKKIIKDGDINIWFKVLNERLTDYTDTFSSKTGRKMFDVTGGFLFFLKKVDHSYWPGFTNQCILTEYFMEKLELLLSKSPNPA